VVRIEECFAVNGDAFVQFERAARSGRVTRRHVLERGLALGLATPVLAALMDIAPDAAAAPASRPSTRSQLAQESSGSFVAVIEDGSPDIDPHSSYVTIGSVVDLGCYEMLIQYAGSSTSEFAPMLARTWEASPDNSTFTFTLPANALFHDGSVCDATAVKNSFIRFRRMELGPYLVLARFCDNPEEQIEVVDATTVRFNLGRPQPLFLAAMASSYGPFVVSPTAVEANKTDDDPWAHEWFLSNAVGTGPFRLVENLIKERIVFERFAEYHQGWTGNHFDNITLRPVAENATRRQLVEQGDADALTNNLTPEDYDTMLAAGELQVLSYPTTRVDWAILNAVTLSREARQGLCYAFPYQDVIDGAYLGRLVRTGPIPTTVTGYDPSVFLYQTDLVKAAELLTAGGVNEGDSLEYLIVSESVIDATVAQLYQANLAQIGINLEINSVDTSTLNDLIFGDAPGEERPAIIGSWAWWPDYNDPWNQLAPNFLAEASGGGGSNSGYWVNDRFEEIMTEAKDTPDPARLAELMIEAQNILTEQDPPAIFFGERQYTTVLRPDIQGFVPNPLYLDSYNLYQMFRAQG
jgi:peptide/nickel transport system substrate-binding protein